MSKMEIDYNTYSDTQLCKLWQEKWNGSESAFCRIFNINQDNFHGYRKGKRISKQSRDAIIKFLQEQHNNDHSIMWTIITDVNFLPPPELKKIIWIDGDNFASALDYLRQNLYPDIHIFFFYLKDRYCRYTYGLGNRQEFTFIHSISHIKDSVDIAIALLATQLNSILGKDVEYIFISKDHFVKDLSVYFSNYRACRVISSNEEFLTL